ncbi:restriction endonuclease subunit S [Faecalibacterium prausnitzii]|uniref:restriction endonuclease subunit S n=1 Tax=Faecalibacterium prausnitzii TaxID=853 RepID=UPI00290E2EB4|nr:restriction endonuclease subunit S [Faecalibacterium prausnitzii]MDU8668958.1 restriction endonuclease subunit S [Faecalibacterium prausnitzii]
MKWEKVKLGNVTDSCLGKMLDQNKNKGDYQPYLANVNVRWGEFDLEDLPLMKFEESEQERYELKYGDLVICEGGEPGRCAIWKEQIPNMKIQKALHRVRVHDCLDYRYLFYWFLLAGKTGELDQYFTGATIKHMPGQKLKEVVIDKPPLEIQHRIADILSAYDDLIENNQEQIKLLEEAAQRLYKEWFVDLRFPGHENTKIVDGVPEGWNECTVESFGTVITGKTPPTSNKEYYTNGKVPFVTIPDMHNVVYPLKTEKRLTIEGAQTQKNKYIPPNSVMISCIGTVGLVSIATEVCQTNQQINSIILNNEDDLYFFYESMLRMKDLLDGLGSNGATMTNVNKSKLEKLIIISPSKDIVKQYNDVCKPLFESALNLSRKNVYLKNMREALLPKLMSGEAEV